MYHYFYLDVHLCFWYYSDNHSKKLHSLNTSAESLWVILGLILVEFLYLLRTSKPFHIKVYKDIFCISSMLNALTKFSQQVLLYWRSFWGIFWSLCFFLHFLRIVWFLMKFRHIFLIILL